MKYFDFIAEITEKSQIKAFMAADAGVKVQEARLYEAFEEWWGFHSPRLASLPQTKGLMVLRTEFFASFVAVLEPVGLLDRFKVTGAIASWWDEVKYELRTLAESGFSGLVDSWIDTIRDALEEEDDEENKGSKNKFDPLSHKLVVQLLADYLEEIGEAEARVADFEQQKLAFEQGEESEESEDGEETVANVAKMLENRRKELKNELKDAQKRIKKLRGSASVKDQSSIAAQRRLGNDVSALEQELADLELMVEPGEAEILAIAVRLEPYNEIKTQLAEARKLLRQLKTQLIERLVAARKALGEEGCEKLVLGVFYEGLKGHLDRYVAAHFQQVVAVVEIWWDKYRVTFRDIVKERDEAAAKLDQFLEGLGYV
jgi:type I restriction enzyme M protein